MPDYAKFMKELLTKKRRIPRWEIRALRENYSAIFQKRVP